jgi:hypothetical protein
MSRRGRPWISRRSICFGTRERCARPSLPSANTRIMAAHSQVFPFPNIWSANDDSRSLRVQPPSIISTMPPSPNGLSSLRCLSHWVLSAVLYAVLFDFTICRVGPMSLATCALGALPLSPIFIIL